MSVITEISKKNIKPVLVDFQNSKFNPNEQFKLESGLYRDKRKKTIVGVEGDKMTYTGLVNENNLYNNYIVINNKRTKTCRLIPVDFALLKPQLKKNEMLDVSVTVHEKSIAELNKQFGSKKTIRQTEQHEKLKMNIDAVKEDLEKTVAAIEFDPMDVSYQSQEDNDGIFRPKINRNASRKEQVYQLHDLIPENVLNSLDSEVTNIIDNMDNIEELKLKSFVEYCLTQLQNSSLSGNELKEKIAILIYMNYLLTYFAVPAKNVTKKYSICKNRDLNFHILDHFSIQTGNTRSRPLSMKIKALCFILVLTLFVTDFEVNIAELAKDIKVGTKKIQEVGRVLALSAGKDKDTMTLKVPLPAVVTISAKRKRK